MYDNCLPVQDKWIAMHDNRNTLQDYGHKKTSASMADAKFFLSISHNTVYQISVSSPYLFTLRHVLSIFRTSASHKSTDFNIIPLNIQMPQNSLTKQLPDWFFTVRTVRRIIKLQHGNDDTHSIQSTTSLSESFTGRTILYGNI